MSAIEPADSSFGVRVRIADEAYLLPVTNVREVVRRGTLTVVPDAPACVLGVCNLRGEVLPIIDTALMVGAGTAADARSVVVLEHAGRRAGLAVDAVDDVEPMTDATQAAESPFLGGASLVDGALIGHIDAGRLLDAVAAAVR
jgi:purine-binding chemotaxis protein CheW